MRSLVSSLPHSFLLSLAVHTGNHGKLDRVWGMRLVISDSVYVKFDAHTCCITGFLIVSNGDGVVVVIASYTQQVS